jgi:hypothetical protein
MGGSVRRLLVVLAMSGLAAGAGFAVTELTGRASHPLRVVDSESGADMADLHLRADRHVTPLDADGLRPGSRFRYSFHVTNAGEVEIRHVVVRSVKVASAPDGMTIVALSDPACWGVGHGECIFQRLGPGETRTVQVTVESSPRSRTGDRLVIRTFTGRFAGTVDGSVPLEVVGGARLTTGRFS